MLSPAPLRMGRETRHSEAGGGALAQPPLTRAGSAATAALSAGAQPEPGLACAAAPRRRRRRRLLCSSGSSSSRHGQAQRGAHPRAARYEAAVVSGTRCPSWSIADPVHSSPRHTPALVPPTPAPAPTHPSCKAAPCPCIPARSISVPGASSAAHLASPCQVLLAPEPPVPIFREGAVPSRSPADSQRPWPTPRLGVQFPLWRIPVSPPGGARPAPPHDGSCPWS